MWVGCSALELGRFHREQARSHRARCSARYKSPVARELAPAGMRSRPLHFFRQTASSGFASAAQPSGSKLPRHGG
ncbi:hypothetical protein DZG01_26075 [Pseudomonas fluorescens]|nr:hypothetical protein DZG01_26075 [Pseudomonas fluorescens]